jgi:beta-galactosidase GanA
MIRAGAHGAFYVGGWLPCFSNPAVKAAAVRFVEKTAERYAGKKNLLFWNVWNEPRNRPAGECFCPHCRKAYGEHLRGRFGTEEKFNEFYGVAEESFETISLPSMAQGYWDIFEFKKWKSGKAIHDNLKFVCRAIREYDKKRPIMSHVGACSGFQTCIDDLSDDFTVRGAVDFYGSSFACDTDMGTHGNRITAQMLGDYMRAVDPSYFMHELYPGLGVYSRYDTPESMEFKQYSFLSAGAKGIVYWQYRAERLGCENDCAGIVNMDGSEREVSGAVRDFGGRLYTDGELFASAAPVKADIAIAFDYDSMLLSAIEDAGGFEDDAFELKQGRNPFQYYAASHQGMYKLLRDADYKVDYLGIRDAVRFKDYKVLYFPDYELFDPAVLPHLEEFFRNGGTLLADEGFALRRLNTWLQPYDAETASLFSMRTLKRRLSGDGAIVYGGKKLAVSPYKTAYRLASGEVLARFSDGEPAVQAASVGAGRVILSGAPIGRSYGKTSDAGWLAPIADWIGGRAAKYEYSDVRNSVYEKDMETRDETIRFLFNWSDGERTVRTRDGRDVVLPVRRTVCLTEKKQSRKE